ncbi:hypothetical protein BASA62_008929 [Batrachochytrium salamandrivorans]|nr:hypothetical protein BASA62_008929 [Batrachochytrium salamandrivorans]
MQAIGADQLQRINPSFSYPDDIYAVALAIVCWGTLHQFLNTLVLKPATTYLFPLTKDAISSLESATKGGKSPVGKADKETALVMSTSQKVYGWPNHPMSTELKTYYIAGIGCSFYTFRDSIHGAPVYDGCDGDVTTPLYDPISALYEFCAWMPSCRCSHFDAA